MSFTDIKKSAFKKSRLLGTGCMLILILFLFPSSVFSQSITTTGFKVGGNVSTLGPTGAGYSSKLGYHLGLFTATRFYQEFGVQLELLVSQQGARSEFLSNLRLKYTYLVAPLLANVYFIESAAIEGGFQLGYLLKASQLDDGDKYDLYDEVRKVDLSGIIGINYNKPFGSIGFRYLIGINNTNNAAPNSEVRFTNKVLQLYIAKTLFTSENK